MTTAATPAEAGWWQQHSDGCPPADAPLLAPYAETQPGVEVLFGPAEHFPVDEANRYRVCLWKIWPPKEPAAQDAVRQRIDALQAALGPLDDETRLLRLQITCLQRCYYAFPATVDTVLRGIGSGTAQLDMALSCEPPWHELRLCLRQRRGLPAEPPDARQLLAAAYLTTLTGWVGGAALAWVQQLLPAHAALAESVYRRLGPPDTAKARQAQRLCTSLLLWAYPSAEPWGARWERISGLLGAQQAADGEDRLGPLIAWNNERGTCHHGFFRHLDYQLAMIGAGGPVALPGRGEARRRIQDAVAQYVHALGCWLARRPAEDAIRRWAPAAETVRTVYGLLGAESPVRRWLVASLWKHLQDNQAHHGRGALDTEPERFALPAGTL